MNAWVWAAATTQWAAATAQTVVLVLALRTRAQVAKLSNKIHNDLREMQKIDWTLAHELAAAAENDQLPPSTIQALHDLAERLLPRTDQITTPGGIIEAEERLGDDEFDEFRTRWAESQHDPGPPRPRRTTPATHRPDDNSR